MDLTWWQTALAEAERLLGLAKTAKEEAERAVGTSSAALDKANTDLADASAKLTTAKQEAQKAAADVQLKEKAIERKETELKDHQDDLPKLREALEKAGLAYEEFVEALETEAAKNVAEANAYVGRVVADFATVEREVPARYVNTATKPAGLQA